MPTLVRYLVICGAIVALTWGMFGVRIGERTLHGHIRRLSEGPADNVMLRIQSHSVDQLEGWRRPAPAAKKPKAKATPTRTRKRRVEKTPTISGPPTPGRR